MQKIVDEGTAKVDTKDINSLIRSLAKAFHLERSGSSHSYYGSFYRTIPVDSEETIVVRISNHPANGDRFSKNVAGHRVSIVVYKDGLHRGEGNFQKVLYAVSKDFSLQDIADTVVKGMFGFLQEGAFIDYSGKAKIPNHSHNSSIKTKFIMNQVHMKRQGPCTGRT